MPKAKPISDAIRPDPPDMPGVLEPRRSELESRRDPYEAIELDRIDMSGKHLASVRLRQSRLVHVDLNDAALPGASLEDVIVSGDTPDEGRPVAPHPARTLTTAR